MIWINLCVLKSLWRAGVSHCDIHHWKWIELGGGLLMGAGPLSPEAIHVGGSHQPLPEVTPLDLSRQGHQSPCTHAQISWRLSLPTHPPPPPGPATTSSYPWWRHCIPNLYTAKSPYVQSVARACQFSLPDVWSTCFSFYFKHSISNPAF